MTGKTNEANPFHWRPPIFAAFVAFVVCISIAFCQADTALLLYLFLIGPILVAFSILLLVRTAFRKGRREPLTLLSTLAAVWVVSIFLFVYDIQHHSAVRSTARWLVGSHNYKEKVLAQTVPENGELRHVVWDGWGWGGEDTTVYLVFDPSDSLSSATSIRQPGKFGGIPCAVPEVRRLEKLWYTVEFYTSQDWDQCSRNNSARQLH